MKILIIFLIRIMNTTISFSLPTKTAKRTRQIARQRGFRSVSQYMRHLVTFDDADLISEDELVRRMHAADREYEEGKLLEADSITDLLRKYG